MLMQLTVFTRNTQPITTDAPTNQCLKNIHDTLQQLQNTLHTQLQQLTQIPLQGNNLYQLKKNIDSLLKQQYGLLQDRDTVRQSLPKPNDYRKDLKVTINLIQQTQNSLAPLLSCTQLPDDIQTSFVKKTSQLNAFKLKLFNEQMELQVGHTHQCRAPSP